MEKKSKYIMWRSKNGFFSALNKKGVLYVWSMVTGALLYSRYDNDYKFTGYLPYQSNENDSLYYSDYYSLSNHSLQLLKFKKPKNTPTTWFEKDENEDKPTQTLENQEHYFKVLKMQMHQDFLDDKNELVGTEVITELFTF